MTELEEIKAKLAKFKDVEASPEALPEGVDPDEYIIATYSIALPAGMDAMEVAQVMAIEQSTGTWVPVPGETSEVRKKHVAKVVGIYEVPYHEISVPPDLNERRYIIQIAYPVINIGQQIPMLLTTVVGNIATMEKLKVLDVRLPKSYVDGFKGPKFGIEGTRKLLGLSDRPLLNNMIKPCTGFPPDIGAKLCYEASAGGTDIIKDDELLGNPSFNRVEERVPKYMEAIDRANSEKGEKTLYTVNVTDEVDKTIENAEKAIELGANAIMVCYLTAGIPVMRKLAEDPSINVPILAHMDFSGAMYVSSLSGLSSQLVLGKLPRLAGADIVVYPAPYGKAPGLKERYLHTAHVLTYPLYGLKSTFPMPSGGLTPAMVPDLLEDLGPDIVVGAGGAIHGHPKGPRAGAMAFRQAIEAAMTGKSIKEMAKEHEELKMALEAF
jgi:2,3-diketo-5-methylthiopentyl-1-phosphate enolase